MLKLYRVVHDNGDHLQKGERGNKAIWKYKDIFPIKFHPVLQMNAKSYIKRSSNIWPSDKLYESFLRNTFISSKNNHKFLYCGVS